MEVTAKVFKSGNSTAVRLPAALKVRAKELVIKRGIDGEIVLYDKEERKRSFNKRLQAWEKMVGLAPEEPENLEVPRF